MDTNTLLHLAQEALQVRDDVRRAAWCRRGLAIPDGDDQVGLIHRLHATFQLGLIPTLYSFRTLAPRVCFGGTSC